MCGIDAAKILKELTMDVVDNIITVKCNLSEDPDVKDPMPESYLCGKVFNKFYMLFILSNFLLLG